MGNEWFMKKVSARKTSRRWPPTMEDRRDETRVGRIHVAHKGLPDNATPERPEKNPRMSGARRSVHKTDGCSALHLLRQRPCTVPPEMNRVGPLAPRKQATKPRLC